MKTFLIVLATFLGLSWQQTGKSHSDIAGLRLLDGYSATRESAVDAAAFTIEGKSGLKINFEAGPSEGSWADPQDEQKYAWYREQRLHGYTVRFALVKMGLKTQWEPEESRGLPPGNILLVTYLLRGANSKHTANFSAKVASSEELADALLMVVTFDPSSNKY
jgi:hypothetical protein